MSSYVGRQAVMNYGTAGSTASTPLGTVETNSTSVENNVIEGNFRSSRTTNHRAGQQKISGSVTMEREIANAGYQLFKTAVKNGSLIALKLIPVTGDATDVIDCDVMISSMKHEEPIEGWQKTTFDYAANIDNRATSIT